MASPCRARRLCRTSSEDVKSSDPCDADEINALLIFEDQLREDPRSAEGPHSQRTIWMGPSTGSPFHGATVRTSSGSASGTNASYGRASICSSISSSRTSRYTTHSAGPGRNPGSQPDPNLLDRHRVGRHLPGPRGALGLHQHPAIPVLTQPDGEAGYLPPVVEKVVHGPKII